MKFLLFFIPTIIIFSCQSSEKATMIIHNARIYTVSNTSVSHTAIAIKEDVIIALGQDEDVLALRSDNTEVIDARGNFLMPGFIEGHGHFSGLGMSLINLNFLESKSWEEIVKIVEEKVKDTPEGEWILGRGWHQEKWDSIPLNNIHNYPMHDLLSAISPNNPVVLTHASGHSLFANKAAMEASGVSKEMSSPLGGEIVRDRDGRAIGVFEERAMQIIRNILKDYQAGLSQEDLEAEWMSAVELAQQECLSNGITSFQDAGSKFVELTKYRQLAEEGKLDHRLWAMMRHSSKAMKGNVSKHRVIGAGNNFFTCRAIKTEVDGALGSFGAWLLKPYSDKPDFHGQNTTPISEVETIAAMALENDMQLCVHAIGDRANREVLDIIDSLNVGTDLRWRMEHAQHMHPEDILRFNELGVIASMQGIHCTSDAPFVVKRLGEQRSKEGAYAWRSFLDAGVIIANGTDAPVEDVDPIKNFYATVTRKRVDNGLEFYEEQSMTREEAIYSYTSGNAYAAFEEDIKGTLEKGKLADIVILSNNLQSCNEEDILGTKVLYTIVGGEVKYKG